MRWRKKVRSCPRDVTIFSIYCVPSAHLTYSIWTAREKSGNSQCSHLCTELLSKAGVRGSGSFTLEIFVLVSLFLGASSAHLKKMCVF